MSYQDQKEAIFLHSGGPLGDAGRAEVLKFLGEKRTIAFVTAANMGDESAYFENARANLTAPPNDKAGFKILHLKWNEDPLNVLSQAEALFVGGGNTYALLKRLREAGLIEPIRQRVKKGMPYLGASAGSNLAGPTILTTNDWNVVGLGQFEALGLVSFNLNPHYKEADPAMAPFSETRDDRIREYHRINSNPVVGIEEGAMVVVQNGRVEVRGAARVKLFRPGTTPIWFNPGETLPV